MTGMVSGTRSPIRSSAIAPGMQATTTLSQVWMTGSLIQDGTLLPGA